MTSRRAGETDDDDVEVSPRYAELLTRAWPIFRDVAKRRTTISYSELAGLIGPPAHHRGIHRTLLTPVSARCRFHGLPDLAALVVRKTTGIPGGGWFDPSLDPEAPEALAVWQGARDLCFSYPWPSEPDARLLSPVTAGTERG